MTATTSAGKAAASDNGELSQTLLSGLPDFQVRQAGGNKYSHEHPEMINPSGESVVVQLPHDARLSRHSQDNMPTDCQDARQQAKSSYSPQSHAKTPGPKSQIIGELLIDDPLVDQF